MRQVSENLTESYLGSVIGIVKCDKKLSQSGVADSGDEVGSGD